MILTSTNRTKKYTKWFFLIAILWSAQSSAEFLKDTPWDSVARAHNIDPYILYAIGLLESAKYQKDDHLTSPVPLTIRTPEGPKRFQAQNKVDAQNYLVNATAMYEDWEIDVCALQINLRWHGDKVKSATELLDLTTCLNVGAQILKQAMASSKEEALGIGRFHSWSDKSLARLYGKKVLSIAKALKASTASKLEVADNG